MYLLKYLLKYLLMVVWISDFEMKMERQTFIWSNKNGTPKIFKVYKLTLAFYMVVACRYGYTDQNHFPKIYHSKFEKISHKILKNHDFSQFCLHWLYFKLGWSFMCIMGSTMRSKCIFPRCMRGGEMALTCIQCNSSIVCHLRMLGLFRK